MTKVFRAHPGGIVLLLAALAATPLLAASSFDIGGLAGVYKHRFTEGQVDGPSYRAEDSLKIVRLSSKRASISVHLDFYNGHSCDIAGIANLEGDALVYRERTDQNETCELSIRRDGARLVLGDGNHACQITYCGMRGSFDGAHFDLAARRAVRHEKHVP